MPRPNTPLPPMAEVENRRYNAVRAAGWTFDHTAHVWRHEHTGRTGLNQHVIHDCLRDHDRMPPCGATRDQTSREHIREWVERAAILRREEEVLTRFDHSARVSREQTERQTNGEFTVDSRGMTVRNNADAERSRDRRRTSPLLNSSPVQLEALAMQGWSTPAVAQAVSRATVRPAARLQATRGKLCRVLNPMWEA